MGKGNTSETCGHIISTQGERTDIDPVMSEQERAELLGRMIADQERSDAAAETLERDIDKGRILEGRNVLALVSTIYREVRDLRRSIINGSRSIDPSAVHLVASMPLDYTDNLNNRHREMRFVYMKYARRLRLTGIRCVQRMRRNLSKSI